MLIRTEIGSDIPRIISFIRDELHQPKIEKKVARIREQALITLSMLAFEEDGHLVGYIICSPVLVNGEDCGWLTISLLLTHPRDINAQLGQALAREAVDSLYEFGYNAVVLFGDDHLEARTGFVSAADLSLSGSPGTKVWVNPLYEAEAAKRCAEITLSDPLQLTRLTNNLAFD